MADRRRDVLWSLWEHRSESGKSGVDLENRVWLTNASTKRGKFLKGTDDDSTAHLLSLEMAKVSGYKHVLHRLALDELQTSNSPRQYLNGKSPHSILFHVLYQILWTNKIERL